MCSKAADIAPQVTWGTNPGLVVPVTSKVPTPKDYSDPTEQKTAANALEYMGLKGGEAITDLQARSSVHWLMHQCAYRRLA